MMAEYMSRYKVIFFILAIPMLVEAQSLPVKPIPPSSSSRSTASMPSAPVETNALAEQRRTTAISLLTSLADAARSYREQSLRARVQARVADALWESDRDRARSLFRRAWEAAEVADREALRRVEEDRRAQAAKYGSAAWTTPPDLRGEVLKLATRHSDELAKEFLAKLEEAREREATSISERDDKPPASFHPAALAPALAQRLSLATRMLETGDIARAMTMADPLLNSVSMEAVTFLSALRQKNAAAADQRFASLLSNAVTDASADANTVSILSSYAFTPFLYYTASRNGAESVSQIRASTAAPALAPQLYPAFFQTAAHILLRPLPPPDQDYTSAGRAGTFLIISRLLPLFERYDPERAPILRTQLTSLSPDVAKPSGIAGSSATVSRQSSEGQTGDELQEAQDEIERASNARERDQAYTRAALILIRQGDLRARDFADKIEDEEVRKHVRQFVDVSLCGYALSKKNIEEALRLARNGELSHAERAWIFTEAARQMKSSDTTRLLELLNEAANEAQRITDAEADRARALLNVATQLTAVDDTRAWEVMAEAVKAANAAPDFTGEDGAITTRLRTGNGIMLANYNVPGFTLNTVFGALARKDLYRSIELAKSFSGEAPKATATLAIVSAVFNEKQKK
jgi:hypothetical protein